MFFLYTALYFACNRSTIDNDHDGWSRQDDCNDDNPAIHPMASEICDGIDNDCDRKIDDEDELGAEANYVRYLDADNDGFGDPTSALGFCIEPTGQSEYISLAGDCDDTDDTIHPDAQEVCDEIDNDCDDLIDNEDDSTDLSTGQVFYEDLDSDDFGNENRTTIACQAPPFHASNPDDCDDWDYRKNPAQREICDDEIDNDCDYELDRDDPHCIAQETFGITAVFLGTQHNGNAGSAVHTAGDINGDAWPDMLIGAPGVGYETGEVYLYMSIPILSSDSLYDAHQVFRGAHPRSKAGSALGTAGDTNGDGKSDILIGAEQTGRHEGLETGYGAVYLFSGQDILYWRTRDLASANTQIVGDDGARFGATLAGLGDVNGDGLDDYIVSAPGSDELQTERGVHLFLGGEVYSNRFDSTTFFALNPTPDNVHEVNPAGDVNGDGRADILIGAAEEQGDAFLFLGDSSLPTTMTAANAFVSFVPESSADQAHQVATTGDISGDQKSDIMIGAPFNDENGTNSGKSYLLYSSDLQETGVYQLADATYQFYGEQSGDKAGYVHDAGDLNEDGKADLLVGAPGHRGQYNNQGRLFTIIVDYQIAMASQSIEGASTQFITGTQANGQFGKHVSYIGDNNRNGRSDILIGAPQVSTHREKAGKVFFASLAADECFNCVEICDDNVDNNGDDFIDCQDLECIGTSFCPVAEICDDEIDNDGDGGIDCIDPDCDRDPTCPVELAAELLGEHPQSRAGWSVTSAGDVDGDGLDDVLIGAPNRSENQGNNGKIYLMYGATLLNTGLLSLQSADFQFLGEEDGDLAGWDLSGIGDIDNDGLDDIMIAAPLNNENGENAGKVYVFLGASIQNSTYALPLNLADYTFVGDHDFAYLGKSLDGDFDINGDGNNDIVLSARGISQWQQPIAIAHVVSINLLSPGNYIISDVSARFESDPMSTDELLHDSYVASIGDMDGDGLDDLALGARGTIYPNYEGGGVYVAHASSLVFGITVEPDIHIYGDLPEDKIGYVHSAGDIDKDGLNDLLIGKENDSEHKCYIYNSNRLGIGSTGASHADFSFDSSCERFALLRDIDGDGHTDYLFHGEQHAYLVYGHRFPHYGDIDFPWQDASYTFFDQGGYFGNFASVGDINGDGLSDIFLVDLFFNDEQGQLRWALY